MCLKKSSKKYSNVPRISKYEYEIALDAMIDLGFDDGYVQSRRSAQKDFIPDFQSHEGLLYIVDRKGVLI